MHVRQPALVQAFEYKELLRELGGAGGGSGLRARLLQEPDVFEVENKNAGGKIRISQHDVDEVEGAAKALASNVQCELEKRFEHWELLENCAIFDPQLFPTEESALSGYGTAEIEALAKQFGKKHGGG